ncbi:MAG: hypothetical protein RL087_704 [Pseudomonadota bacterium]
MRPRHLTLITGASRGMGLAMAQQRLAEGHDLLCISRRSNADLSAAATRHGQHCTQWERDLSDAAPVAAELAAWLGPQAGAGWASVTLINNAALIPDIGPLDATDAHALATALRVGLEAPMMLSGAFLRATADWPGVRKVLNISSGLGRRAMASQAAYCATKAAMDHSTRCVALEQERLPRGARVCSLAPGVIDTDMQVQLRSTDPARFPDVGNFIGMKDKGQLTRPDDAARRVLAYLDRADFGSNPVADVRD